MTSYWLNFKQDSFYKPLNPEQSRKAFRNEYDFDSPEAVDFDILVECLHDLKKGYVAMRSPKSTFLKRSLANGLKYLSTPSPNTRDRKKPLLYILLMC